MRRANEFSRPRLEPLDSANRRAGHHQGATVANGADDAVSRVRKPQLDAGIENLIRGRIPPELEHQRARPGGLGVSWQRQSSLG